MKRPNLFKATILSLMVVVCLISVPALSGENPWDSDGGNGNGTGEVIDTTVDEATVTSNPPQVGDPYVPPSVTSSKVYLGWIDRISIRVSSFILKNFRSWTSKKAQLTRPAY